MYSNAGTLSPPRKRARSPETEQAHEQEAAERRPSNLQVRGHADSRLPFEYDNEESLSKLQLPKLGM